MGEDKVNNGTPGWDWRSLPCPALPENNIHQKISQNWAAQRKSDPPVPMQQLWLKIFASVLTEVVSASKILLNIKIIYWFHFNSECKMLPPQKEAEVWLPHP